MQQYNNEKNNKSSFSVNLHNYEINEDATTYLYHVKLVIDGNTIELRKRYSDFYNLNSQLLAAGFLDLPSVPQKTLVRLNFPEDAEKRRLKLDEYMKKLLQRADVRHSVAFNDFCCKNPASFDVVCLETSFSTDILPFLSAVSISQDCETGLIAVVYKNTAKSSKLGVAWEIVDPLKRGALAILVPPDSEVFDDTELDESQKYKLMDIIVKQSTRKVCFCHIIHHKDQLVVFDSDGIVSVYTYRQCVQDLEFTLLTSVELHVSASPVSYTVHPTIPHRFAEIGEENGLRIFDVTNNEISLLGSGRVEKGLINNTDEKIRAVQFFVSNCVEYVLIGTSFGQILKYNIDSGQPQLVGVLNCVRILQTYLNINLTSRNKLKYVTNKWVNKLLKNQDMNLDQVEFSEYPLTFIKPLTQNRYILFVGMFIVIVKKSFLEAKKDSDIISRIQDESFDEILFIFTHNVGTVKSASAVLVHDELLFLSYGRGFFIYDLADIDNGCVKLLYANEKAKWGTIREMNIVRGAKGFRKNMYLASCTSLGGPQLIDITNINAFRKFDSININNYSKAIECEKDDLDEIDIDNKVDCIEEDEIAKSYYCFPPLVV